MSEAAKLAKEAQTFQVSINSIFLLPVIQNITGDNYSCGNSISIAKRNKLINTLDLAFCNVTSTTVNRTITSSYLIGN
jgi:hypothetical protein